MKTKIKWLALAAAALTLNLGAASCSSESKTPEWEWDDPEPEPEPVPASEKPRFIWVDAAANFPDFANSKENIYVGSASLNDKEYIKLYYSHTDLLRGGTLHLDMTPTPSTGRNTSPTDLPYSFSNEQ